MTAKIPTRIDDSKPPRDHTFRASILAAALAILAVVAMLAWAMTESASEPQARLWGWMAVVAAVGLLATCVWAVCEIAQTDRERMRERMEYESLLRRHREERARQAAAERKLK